MESDHDSSTARRRLDRSMGWMVTSSSFFSFLHPPPSFPSTSSDAARHRAHGQVADARLRVSGEGPEAVHGRLRQHSQHEQRQGERGVYLDGVRVHVIGLELYRSIGPPRNLSPTPLAPHLKSWPTTAIIDVATRGRSTNYRCQKLPVRISVEISLNIVVSFTTAHRLSAALSVLVCLHLLYVISSLPLACHSLDWY